MGHRLGTALLLLLGITCWIVGLDAPVAYATPTEQTYDYPAPLPPQPPPPPERRQPRDPGEPRTQQL